MRDRIMGDKKKEYRDKRTGMQTVRSVIFAIVLIITGFTSIISVSYTHLVDILRCPRESGPRIIRFSDDGKFAYILFELSNAVSYTHLDVYKRQVFTSASTVKGFVEGTKGLDYTKVKAACIGTVSYTHLDVYKRQELVSNVQSGIRRRIRGYSDSYRR